jgi:hypothetical protein
MDFIRCIVCGESVNVGVEIMCDKCKSAILKMRKQMEFNSTPKTFIVRFIDKDGNIVYITKSPKHITKNNIKSQIKILKNEIVEQSYRFDSDVENAKFFTRTQAEKLCKNFHLLQENGYFNEFVKGEVIKDNKVSFYWDFEKYKLEENKND